MEQSILKSTKKVLNIGVDDDSFDFDIMIHINSAFSTLNDLGVGPLNGFAIEDDSAEWTDFLLEDPVQLNRVKPFVSITTRLAFDPPTSSYLLTSAEKQLEEITFRLSAKREEVDWVDPDPAGSRVDVPNIQIIDGGDPSEP